MRKLEEAGSDNSQTRITNYFVVLNKLALLLKENSELSKALVQAAQDNAPDFDTELSVEPILHNMLLTAQKNVHKTPHKRQHEEMLIKFATSLFIYSGPMAYNFLHNNLPNALPSLRTVQRKVNSEYKVIDEGTLRFDELDEHLKVHDSPPFVAIGEDATRLIARVDYDKLTDRLVGFVLPIDNKGLPQNNIFLASSFAAIENYFKTSTIAKHAFLYMAQPLKSSAPAFILGCMTTDNKFTAEHVLKRWSHIHTECAKRGITVVSFGADGDSRELKSMRISCQLLQKSQSQFTLSPSATISPIDIPKSWSNWFAVKHPTYINCSQDTVHIAVKLKSRLLKPSIILPMGKYIAGVHHLKLVKSTFKKGDHSMREKDLNHNDKQNFEAVRRITSQSTVNLLKQIPDANGTIYYLEIIKCVTNSFLEKEMLPLQRVQSIWYATFFCRYWRQYILSHQAYTLQNNFITLNAYLCIEINAHSLITFLLLAIEKHDSSLFLPWLLGSQSCEKAFRACRSMSSTFSTIINFGMLGLLRRLHRMQIQMTLEAQNNGIRYPVNDKQGSITEHDLSKITFEDIENSVLQGKRRAQEAMEDLGIKSEIKNELWEYPPMPVIEKNEEEIVEKDGDEYFEGPIEEEELLHQTLQNEVIDDVLSIENATDAVLVSQNLAFKKIQNVTTQLPLYKSTIMNTASKEKGHFLPIDYNGQTMYIRKSTAVWLFNEGERLSSDRLIRVRDSQPFHTTMEQAQEDDQHVHVAEAITTGDMCVFLIDENIKIGRVLQFAYVTEKQKKVREFKEKTVATRYKNEIGVLCTWFDKAPQWESTFIMRSNSSSEAHFYVPIETCVLLENHH